MTRDELRDHFAGVVLAGVQNNKEVLRACLELSKEKGMSTEKFIADVCYCQADALLKRREQPVK